MENREIKFRSYNPKTGKMLDLKEITPLALCPDLNTDGLFIPFVEDIPIMQYTGLKDKNGVEIYEGDIVKHIPTAFNTQKCTGEIKWFKGRAQFYLNDNGGIHYLDSLNEYEVVGNIYNNTDLKTD